MYRMGVCMCLCLARIFVRVVAHAREVHASPTRLTYTPHILPYSHVSVSQGYSRELSHMHASYYPHNFSDILAARTDRSLPSPLLVLALVGLQPSTLNLKPKAILR